MDTYHKINTVFKRDPETKHKTLLIGKYSEPEFTYLKDCLWRFDEKVDGMNMRVKFGGDGLVLEFAGKTDKAQIPSDLMSFMDSKFTRENMSGLFNDANEVCLYGEGYGPGIQSGGWYNVDSQKFILFDVWVDGWWLKREDVAEIARALVIPLVPVIGWGDLNKMVDLCRDGFPSFLGDGLAEGIIARPDVELKNRAGKRIITKLKHKDFQ